MTVIAGYKDNLNSTYWIGSDSCGSNGTVLENYGTKLIDFENYTVGFANSYIISDLIKEHKNEFPKKIVNIKTIRKFGETISKHIWGDDNWILLFCCKTGLYVLDDDYQTFKIIDGYTAIGGGYEIALGSLYTAKKNEFDGESAIRIAINAAIKHSNVVAGNIFIRSY